MEKQALVQAKKLGLITKDVFEKSVKKIVRDEHEGAQILAKTNSVISEMAEKGYPKTTTEDLLEFMKDKNNPADPVKAYKIMFEEQIDQIKEQQIKGIKPAGMVTSEGSTAGAKAPPPPEPITKENLEAKLKAHFRG